MARLMAAILVVPIWRIRQASEVETGSSSLLTGSLSFGVPTRVPAVERLQEVCTAPWGRDLVPQILCPMHEGVDIGRQLTFRSVEVMDLHAFSTHGVREERQSQGFATGDLPLSNHGCCGSLGFGIRFEPSADGSLPDAAIEGSDRIRDGLRQELADLGLGLVALGGKRAQKGLELGVELPNDGRWVRGDGFHDGGGRAGFDVDSGGDLAVGDFASIPRGRFEGGGDLEASTELFVDQVGLGYSRTRTHLSIEQPANVLSGAKRERFHCGVFSVGRRIQICKIF